MARKDFIDQLKALGHAVEQPAEDRIAFAYVPRIGRFRGKELTLGFVVGNDFPANCPSGPHIKPELLPLKNGGEHPDGGIQASQQFGEGWQYWSRPFPNWNGSGRTAKVYMEHIDRLFDQ